MSAFAAVDVIRVKRDGGVLSDAQIDWVVDAYTRGVVADEQMSALAMAILLNGMTGPEIARWTAAMIASGERLDLSAVRRPTVDKHSTGGVGDKITLPLTPLVAACGAAVPQLSGRGLGHTGGTLDKLESIPGWRATVSNDEFIAQLDEVGAVICAAGAGLAPADRKLYALRDVTGTVEAIPLIASSIMSKKIAEGTGALVLDVKVGSGAFMKSVDQARELARTMVELGGAHGVRTVALLTDMSTPLGLAIGNAVEVTESVEVLAGGGPADVVELTLALAREMLDAAGLPDADPAAALRDGRAMDSWRAMVRAQGGDPDAPMPAAAEVEVVRAEQDGHVAAVDAYAMGVAAWRLGAGRARKEDPVSVPAGVVLHKRPGDAVRAGDPLYELRAEDASRIPAALAEAANAVRIASTAPASTPLVIERIG
ncbi:thymidine phosphorylase [Micromonospora parathelypteridis]|uniref:Thymidine phosphorylase n=1 Tax=Micromonospora parathelypteridis TaxID=1839617 RepID=A0A840VPP8_9ACTN|nr:thymidine phosphorylase [Micromonospora parathelypteridis]MBB5479022.1 thymidine phosphorylase [Micromonospora parathelypteridis]GGO03464.1 thymidine phosphorylase [Micromonospora parathelypteridis]